MMRPSRWGSGFRIFTTIHPRLPPTKNVNPMFTGINHLAKIDKIDKFLILSSQGQEAKRLTKKQSPGM